MLPLRRAFALLALALVAAPLIFSAPLFDPDEGLHAAIAQEMVQRGDYVTPTFLGEPFLDKPILFFWAEALSLRLFGHNEAAVRIPPLLFGLFGMMAVAALGRALFGETAGLLGGIAYGTMLLPLGVSEVAVHDVGLVGFMCVACWCMLKVAVASPQIPVASPQIPVASPQIPVASPQIPVASPQIPVASPQIPVASAFRRKDLLLAILAGACLGLSILTKGLVGVVFTGIFAACLAIYRPAALVRLGIALSIAGIIALLVAAPWYIAMERAHPGYLHYYFVERHLQGYLTATQRHAGRPVWYYLPIVVGGALPWTGYLFMAARTARREPLRLVMWSWLGAGLVFLSIGESKLVTYALPLFPALAILAGEYLARHLGAGIEGKGARFAFQFHAVALALIPQIGLIVIRRRFGAEHPGLPILVDVTSLLTLLACMATVRSRSDRRFAAGLAGMSIFALVGMMLVAPRAAEWMTSRDLAAALNRGGVLPSHVSVLDERIGSLVFYLDPALRADASPDRIDDVSYAEAIARVRVEPDEAVLAVRLGQLPRFNRLFPSAPTPDVQAGTFAVFRAATLRRALGAR